MWGNSESSLAAVDSSLTMAENCVLGTLIVTSTIPLEREILASLRTFDGSGLLALDRVSENLLIATTRVLMLDIYGAICTPHIFLYNQQRVLSYKGRIDDNY